MTHYAYIVKCRDNSLYCGYTTDLKKRLAAHNSRKGAKYTRSRLPVSLYYFEEFDSKGKAMSREWHLKRLSHSEKAALTKTLGPEQSALILSLNSLQEHKL
ncbi:MAG: GIY-YIG nuclease family protein [Butyrivibrio sp.]|nr:GIY-YIG nuclease family protein [Butyrivibrio sp.]